MQHFSIEKSLASLLFLVFGVLGVRAQDGGSADFATVRARMYQYALDYQGGENTSVPTLLSKLNNNGSWTDRSASKWILDNRLLFMAKAYNEDPIYQGSPVLKDAFYNALNYWLDNHPELSGWKTIEVDAPRVAAYIALLMYDPFVEDLNDPNQAVFMNALLTKINDFIREAWPDAVAFNRADIVLGANMAFRLFPLQALFAIEEDANKMGQLLDFVSGTFEVGEGFQGQGFQGYSHVGLTPDGSWHQHNFDGGQNYWLSYGGSWMQWTTRYGSFAKGTAWEIPQSDWIKMQNGVLDGLQWIVYKNQGLYSVGGRHPLAPADFRMKGSRHAGFTSQMISVAGDELTRTSELQEVVNRINDTNAPGIDGSRYFWNSDLMIHSRPNLYAAIKMISERTMGPELGNGTYVKTFHLGDGSFFLMKDGREYDQARVGWNVQSIPGTTAEQRPSGMPTNSSTTKGYLRSVNSFAGGVTDSRHSVSGFHLNRYHAYARARAKKGYFMFEDEFVFLGSDIHNRDGSGDDIWTTLEQSQWETPIVYKTTGSQQVLPLNNNATRNFTNVSSPVWFHHNGVGYVIIPETPIDIKLWAEYRSGNWRDLDGDVKSKSGSAWIYQLVIDHGKNPSSDKYQYMVLPNVSVAEMDAFVSNMPTEIVANNEDVQAVRHTTLDKTQMIFYSGNTSVTDAQGRRYSSDKPIVVMARETADSIYLHVSDPNQIESAVKIGVNAELSGSGVTYDASTGESLVEINLPGGLYVGKQVDVALAKGASTKPTATIAFVKNGIYAPVSVDFDASASSDPNGTIVSYAWDFGDGTLGNGPDPTHVFNQAGTYTIQLTVTDNDGETGTAQVTIKADPEPCTLSNPWLSQDIGLVGQAGSACDENKVFTINGAGDDIWGTDDAFQFVYQPLNGDGEIVARVLSLQQTDPWAKAGVMIRESLTPDAANAMMYISGENRWSFQRREDRGLTTNSTRSNPGEASFPFYVRLERQGAIIVGSYSEDGINWVEADRDTLNLSNSVYVGLAVTSHNSSLTTTATFDEVDISQITFTCDVPTDWNQQDIGAVGFEGSTCDSAGVFKMYGSGTNVWNSTDEYHFLYQPLSGDGEIVARVLHIDNTHEWAKAGVMMRASMDPQSANAMMYISPAGRWSFQRRTSTAGTTFSTRPDSPNVVSTPHWVRLVRSGDIITGYHSPDGINWIMAASEYIPMGTDILVGLGVNSHDNGAVAYAELDNVSVGATTDPGTFPVEFLEFEAKANPRSGFVQLDWKTASEQNNDYFTVERSLDGTTFEEIDRVGSQGNGSQVRSYEAFDHNPIVGEMFYRIRQTDLDGSFSFSETKSVSFSPESFGTMEVSPIPASQGEWLTLSFQFAYSTSAKVQLMGYNGKTVWSARGVILDQAGAVLQVPTENLVPGFYYLVVQGNEDHREVMTRKLLIKD